MRAVIVGLCALLMIGAASSAQAQNPFKLSVYLVDADGKAVASLKPDQARVLENGVEGTILKVEAIDGTPRVQILIDNGQSVGDTVSDLRTGLTELLKVLPDGVEVSIYTTAPQGRMLLKPTTDKDTMLKAVGRLTGDGGVGRFVESLSEAAQRLLARPGGSGTIITVATPFGDGEVTEFIGNEMLTRVQKSGATVHVILLSKTSSAGFSQGEAGSRVAKITGGRFEAITASNRLATLMPEIGQIVAKTTAQKGGLFRLTVQRPNGASGALGKISFGSGMGTALRLTIEQ